MQLLAERKLGEVRLGGRRGISEESWACKNTVDSLEEGGTETTFATTKRKSELWISKK